MGVISLGIPTGFCQLLWLSLPILSLVIGQDLAALDPTDYCEGETFKADCENDEVVVITAARYGRMRIGKCLNRPEGVGCEKDVLSLFDLWCSGRHSCEVRVTSIIDLIPAHERPCSKDFRSYLEASYTCVKVIRQPQEACISLKEAEVKETSGYLASVVTDETTCGSYDAPWVLRMGVGQTVDIDLYDFAVSTRKNSPEVCHVYAIIKEKGKQSASETICGGRSRKVIAYSSNSNILEIRMVTKRSGTENGQFLLRYKAKGCANPAAPPYGWVQRIGDRSNFGCNASTVRWQLKCEEDKWTGDSINCTEIGDSNGPNGKPVIGLFTGSQWASIVIILAIAVTLGLVIFLVGLVFLRRKRNMRDRRTNFIRDRPPVPDMYLPQYRDSVSTAYGAKALSAMDCSSSENDYYRTWQLQRHPPGGRNMPSAGAHGSYPNSGNDETLERAHQAGLICTNPRCAQRPYDTMDADRRYPSEHIYESPKFDRKVTGPPPPPPPPQNQTSNSTTGSITQYFELDPDHV